MNVQKLFKAVSWDSVAHSLIEAYTDDEYKATLPGFKEVFEKVLSCDPSPNDDGTTVCVRLIEDEGESWFDVYGRVPGKDVSYALELSTFHEWAGYDVDEDTLQRMPLPKIAAHVLWEMTWFGFDDRDIQARRKELQEAAQNAKLQFIARDAVQEPDSHND